MSKELIRKAYQALSDVTPLKYDCGLLCSSCCCKSNFIHAAEAGMYLLPGEEDYLKEYTDFSFSKDKTESMLLCNGTCDREFRPFACRIFPYYASLEENSGKIKITVRPDSRATALCPLIHRSHSFRTTVLFKRKLKRAVRILISDEKIKDDLIKTSEFIKEIDLLRNKFFPRDSI